MNVNTGNGTGHGNGHARGTEHGTGAPRSTSSTSGERALKVSIVVSGETALGSVLLRDEHDDVGIKLAPDAARTIARGLLEAADEVGHGNSCVGRLVEQGHALSDIFTHITQYYGKKYAMEQAGGAGTTGVDRTKGER